MSKVFFQLGMKNNYRILFFFEIECNKNIRASKTIRTFFCTRNPFSLQLERNCRVEKINTKKSMNFLLS